MVVHGHHVLLGQDVALGFDAELLLHALAHGTRAEEVGGVNAVSFGELRVDDHTQAGEGGNGSAADVGAAGAPGDVVACLDVAAGEGQHPDLLQVVVLVRVQRNRGKRFATLAQFCLGSNHGHGTDVGVELSGDVQDVVGEGCTKDAFQLGQKGGGAELVDGGGQVSADGAHRVGSSAELGEVVHGVAEATVEDRHHLLGGGDLLGGQVAFAALTPGAVGLDDFFQGVDRLEVGDADAGAASAGIEGAVAGHHTALHEGGALDDFLAQIGEKLGASDEVTKKGAAVVILKWGCHDLKSGVAGGYPRVASALRSRASSGLSRSSRRTSVKL